jgi:GT2 family glycosyltransferase
MMAPMETHDPVADDVRRRMAEHLRGSHPTEGVTAARRPTVTLRPSERPDVSVVTVTYGTGPIVLDCLAALADTLSDTPSEVIVVDHPVAADRGLATSARLRLLTSGIRLIRGDANYGFGGGNDVGIAHARASIVVLVNPDVVVQPGWLEPLVAALDDPTVGIAAPVLFNSDGTVQEAGQTLDDHAITRPITERPEQSLSEVTFASAACWVLRRDDYHLAGGFDPAYHPAYFEDVDLALRMARLGLRTVVVRDSTVIHHHGSSTRGRTHQALQQQAIFRHRWTLQRG